MNIKYQVELSQPERDQLEALLSGGRHAARKLKRAQILLAADNGGDDDRIPFRDPKANPSALAHMPSRTQCCIAAKVMATSWDIWSAITCD